MAVFTKTWLGTTSDRTLDTNWQAINVRTPAYTWTLSGSGTNEYYLRLGSGNPGFAATPTTVTINGVAATSGTVGSLTAGKWGYGNNDTLGYNTLYVRLSDGTDPDTKTNGYITFNQVPQAAENVRLPAGSGAAMTGGDFSGTAIADFVVEDGNTTVIGTSSLPLIIDPDLFSYAGLGQSYIDLYTANISPQVLSTASAAPGTCGLYLTGSNLATVNVIDGSVGLAARSGETSTAASVRTVGDSALVIIGKGTTLANLLMDGGTVYCHCAVTTAITINRGTCTTLESGAVALINANGGLIYPNSTGTVTSIVINGGSVNGMTSGDTRTWSSVKINSGSVKLDPAVVTITTWAAPDYPINKTVSRA